MLQVLLGLGFLFELEQFFHAHPRGRRIGNTPNHWQTPIANLYHGTGRERLWLSEGHHAKSLPEELGDQIFHRPPLYDGAQFYFPN